MLEIKDGGRDIISEGNDVFNEFEKLKDVNAP
jgi:hypothetical protein